MRNWKTLVVAILGAVLLALIPHLMIGCALSQEKYNAVQLENRGHYAIPVSPQTAAGPTSSNGIPDFTDAPNFNLQSTPSTQPSSELWIIGRNPPAGPELGPDAPNAGAPAGSGSGNGGQAQFGTAGGGAAQRPTGVSPNGIVFGNVAGGRGFAGGFGAGTLGQSRGTNVPGSIGQSTSTPPNEVGGLRTQASAAQIRQEEIDYEAARVKTDSVSKAKNDAEIANDLHLANPGSGELIVPNHDGQTNVPVPLDHTDVSAQIQGYIASVHVAQRYRNPFNEKIEAVYVFPLPQDAAVSEFVMTIGDRHIRGIIREKAEAERIYHEARAQGYVASLLVQDRPNIFTQSVANIEPNKQIDINMTYFNTMSYVDGSYEFVFPMVVGPRFNPPGSTDGVGAVGRGNQGISGQKTEVQYLKPNERSGHDIALSVDLNAGVPIEKLESANHKINVKQESPGHALVTLDPADSIPNKDFVLRYKVAGGQVKSAMFVQRDERGGFFTLMLFPPASLSELPRQPLEMVFTIDVSGSQNGAPLAQEKAATRYCLTNMNPGDTFQIVRFGDTAKTLFPAPVPVTRSNVQEALSYVDGLDAHEGTMLVDGVHASLLFPHDPSRLRFVAFLTDGFIGNESDALREIHNCLGPARIFSFGVGSSTNRYLLDHMATMGNGVAAYLGLNDDADKIMAAYFERISHPALTDISVDLGDMHASEVFPERIGDLFVGRPVVISGRFSGATPKQVIVHGNVGGEARQIVVPINAENIDTGASHALASVWARTKLADLGDRSIWQSDDALPTQMRQVALDYGLVSGFTSFVAVDSLTKTAGDHGTTVAVPVPVPDGVRYETTVQDGNNQVPRD